MFRLAAISILVLACSLCASARTRPHYGGILHVDIQGDPWREPDGIARGLVFDTLTRTNSAGAVLPALAIRWEAQNANHRWQFWLRPGVHFHDGTLLTAEIVMESITQSCPNNCLWTTVRVLGDSVLFTSDSPMLQLPAELARSRYGIKHEISSQLANGTGPFRVTNSAGGVLSLAANEDCWQGRPFLDGVEIRSGRSIRDQWLDFSVGRADLVEVPPGSIRQAQQEHLPVFISRPADLLLLVISTNSIFRDDQLRQAVTLAVDRSALYQVVFQKQGEVTGSLLPADLTGYAFLFPTERDLNNVHGPQQPSTTPLALVTDSTNTSIQLAAQRIALNLHEAGFNVQFTPQANKAGGGDLLLRSVHLEATASASGLAEMFSIFGERAPENNDDQAALYRMEKTFLQKHTVVPLLYLPHAYAVGGRVRNLELSADGTPLISDASLEDSK